MEVSLQDILSAREERVRRQQQLLKVWGKPLLSFTMNIAGPVKTSPLIERGFREGLARLEKALPPEQIRFREESCLPTGCQAFLVVDMEGEALKALCVALEEQDALGRLFDMDVLVANGQKLERSRLRGCLVCGAPGRGCAAGRLHSVAQLQAATGQLLEDFFFPQDAQSVASAAVHSLMEEVKTTPKPGLVDQRNTGSHPDMTLAHFIASAQGLQPYFLQCVSLGRQTAHLSPEETFLALRQPGLEAEQEMYRITGGVNTHKGAIYTLGILCGSIGRLWKGSIPETEEILAQCASMVSRQAAKALEDPDVSTVGGRLCKELGLRGIRGEMAAGLPHVAQLSLPVYREGLERGLSQNAAGAVALVHLIATLEDTTLYHRGGVEGAAWAKKEAAALLRRCPYPALSEIAALDDAFIARNLTAGGCADLLAATYFLHSISIIESSLYA